MMSASKTLKKNLSIAVTAVFLAVAAFACWAIDPSKAYADTTDSHLTVASEVHVLVDSEGNVTIPNATVTNDGTCAAYIMGCSSPDGLGWTCDAVGKRIEVGQSITATWRSAGPVSDKIAAQLGEEPYYAGNLTYTYTDGDLKGTVSLDNTDPTVGDTITATVTGANVPDDKLTYRWVKVKDGSETSIDGATGSTYTATDDDAGYELVCKVSSTDDICQGTISGATGAVKKIQAFAVYSADDGSLNFYKRTEVPTAGSTFEGKTATAVYTGIETYTYTRNLPWNGYASKIKTATVVDDGLQPKSTASWFTNCKSITQCDMSKLDTSTLADASGMFYNCSSLTTIGDLSSWDVSNLADASDMFYNCSSLTTIGDISGWDVSKMTKTSCMFSGCSSLTTLNLSGWDVSNLANATEMFGGCSKLTTIGDLSSWDVSNLTNAINMFSNCSSLTTLNLSGWDVSNLANASHMFDGCSKLTTIGDLSSWNISKMTNASSMFSRCSSLTTIGDLSGWDVSNLASAQWMFYSCSSLTTIGDLSGWDVSNLASAQWMFFNCSRLSVNCSSWDVSKVTNHSNFNTNAPGVILPSAWQTSSDEGDKDSTIAPLCEEQGNGDALSVSDENGNDEAASKTDGEASADSETEGSNTASATDEAGAKEETSDDIVQEKPAAA